MAVQSASDLASYMDDWGEAFEFKGVTLYGEVSRFGTTDRGVSSHATHLRIADADLQAYGLAVGEQVQIDAVIYDIAEIERDGDGADFARVRLTLA